MANSSPSSKYFSQGGRPWICSPLIVVGDRRIAGQLRGERGGARTPRRYRHRHSGCVPGKLALRGAEHPGSPERSSRHHPRGVSSVRWSACSSAAHPPRRVPSSRFQGEEIETGPAVNAERECRAVIPARPWPGRAGSPPAGLRPCRSGGRVPIEKPPVRGPVPVAATARAASRKRPRRPPAVRAAQSDGPRRAPLEHPLSGDQTSSSANGPSVGPPRTLRHRLPARFLGRSGLPESIPTRVDQAARRRPVPVAQLARASSGERAVSRSCQRALSCGAEREPRPGSVARLPPKPPGSPAVLTTVRPEDRLRDEVRP